MDGYDDVDLVLIPHVARVVVKAINAGMTQKEIEAKALADEKDRIADLSISAFERGRKKRRAFKKRRLNRIKPSKANSIFINYAQNN